jgi:uncharacterized protein (DUF983 family)
MLSKFYGSVKLTLMKIFHVIRKLLVGLLLRCPNCERGRVFRGLFQMEATCPNCGVRFERAEGESIGGTMLNLSIAEVLTVGGLILTEGVLHAPLAVELIFWVSFNILFVVLFYRHARSMWVAITYLTVGLYPDDEQPKT